MTTIFDDDLHDDFARFHLDISSLFDDEDDDTGTIVEDDEDDPGADYYLGLEFEDDDQAATQPLESADTGACDLCGGTLTIAVGITDCPACGSVGHIDCPRCDGTGCVFVEAPCPSCTTPEAASS